MKTPNGVVAGILITCFSWNSAFAAISHQAVQRTQVTLSSEEILSPKQDIRGELTRSLDTEEVQKELTKLGIDKKEVQLRLAAMSNSELQQVQQGVERQAGGDVVVISLTTLLIIALILVILAR